MLVELQAFWSKRELSSRRFSSSPCVHAFSIGGRSAESGRAATSGGAAISGGARTGRALA